MIIGNIKQNKYVLSTDNQDSFLAYEGSGNLELEVTFNDSTFQGYTKNFFYCKKTLNSKTYDLQFNASKNIVILPPNLFSDEGKIFIGLVGSKIENDMVVQINTSPVCFYNGKAVNPKNIEDTLYEGSAIGLGLTPEQSKALDNLLKNAVYTKNVSKEYAVFKKVFDTGVNVDWPYCAITNDLKNVKNSNSSFSVRKGDSYRATLTADDTYKISNVKIEMGEEDITNASYLNGDINIISVNSDLTISAQAIQIENSLPQDGLINFFDFRNAKSEQYQLANWGSAYKFIDKNDKNKSIAFNSVPITIANEYGVANWCTRELRNKDNDQKNTSFDKEFTIIGMCYGNCQPAINGNVKKSNINGSLNLIPQYETITGEKKSGALIPVEKKKTDYGIISIVFKEQELDLYYNGVKKKNVQASQYIDFSKWYSKGITNDISYLEVDNYMVSYVMYNRALTDIEIVNATEYLKTLEVV